MAGSDNNPISVHFQSCLILKSKKDGNLGPGVAKGDCTMMLQLIRMKLDDFPGQLDPYNPGRFRGTSVLKEDMEKVLGAVDRFHVTKWGASHFRGALRDDEKRGNKRHIIKLIELLNGYSGTMEELQTAYEQCIRMHHQFWESFSLRVVFQQAEPFQKRLASLLTLSSFGRVQQGLVFGALRRKYGTERRITTKKTFAADEQSSQHGTFGRGDVQVWSADQLLLALEVKDAVVDATAWQRVRETHGQHDYALFILGTGFRPPRLQQEISSLTQTFAIHLFDFLATMVFLLAGDEKKEPTTILNEILTIYNHEFCELVEKDVSIKIVAEVEN